MSYHWTAGWYAVCEGPTIFPGSEWPRHGSISCVQRTLRVLEPPGSPVRVPQDPERTASDDKPPPLKAAASILFRWVIPPAADPYPKL